MKKYLASILSLILALAMVFSLVACDNNSDSDDDDDEESSKSSSSQSESSDESDVDSSSQDDDAVSSDDKKDDDDKKPSQNDDKDVSDASVEGTWVAIFDFNDMLSEKFASNPDTAEIMEYVEFGSLEVEFYMELQKNGKAKMYIDEDALMDLAYNMLDDIVDGFIKMIKIECEDLYGMSYDEYLAKSGMTEQQLKQTLKETMSQLIDTKVLTEGLEEIQAEGTYEFDGKNLKLISDDGAVDTAEYKNGKFYMTSEGFSMVFEKK